MLHDFDGFVFSGNSSSATSVFVIMDDLFGY